MSAADPPLVNQPAGHTRGASQGRRQALLRHSSKGPLDADDSLAKPLPATPSAERESIPPSTPSSRTSASSPANASPTRRPLTQWAPTQSPKVPKRNDLTFLLRPQNYQTLNPATVLAPAFASNQPPEDATLTELLEKGHHVAAANTAAANLVDPNQIPFEDPKRIVSLLYARFAALQLCGQVDLAARESRIFGDLSNDHIYRVHQDGDPKCPPWGRHLLPWMLRILIIRLQTIGFGDQRRGTMQLYDMAREARSEFKRAAAREYDVSDAERALHVAVWEDRLADLGLVVADVLVQMNDLETAMAHLKTLVDGRRSEMVSMRIVLLLLQTGDIASAKSFCETQLHQKPELARQKPLFDALFSTTEGNYQVAVDQCSVIAERETDVDADDETMKLVAHQNLAVTLVYSGRLAEAQQMLEKVTHKQAAWKHAKDATFNLATIYELVADNERCKNLKLELAELVRKDSLGDRPSGDFKL